ncbi:hypothetical protein C0J52_20522, partial [Blattella germanica]
IPSNTPKIWVYKNGTHCSQRHQFLVTVTTQHFNMYKLVILALAISAASAGLIGAPAVATYAAGPAVVGAGYAAPAVVGAAYAAPAVAPVAYAAPAVHAAPFVARAPVVVAAPVAHAYYG